MIGTALAIGSAIASLIGSQKSAEANRKYDESLKGRQSELQSWYDREYNTNYLDTAEAQSTVNLLKESLKDRIKKVDQGNAITGASDEARVATAESGQKNYASGLSRIAGYGTQYKDAIRREKMMRQGALDQLEGQNLLGKSQNWTNFMTNAMNAGIGFAEADGAGAFDKWDDKIANWRKAKILEKAGGAVTPVSTSHIQIPRLGNR